MVFKKLVRIKKDKRKSSSKGKMVMQLPIREKPTYSDRTPTKKASGY